MQRASSPIRCHPLVAEVAEGQDQLGEGQEAVVGEGQEAQRNHISPYYETNLVGCTRLLLLFLSLGHLFFVNILRVMGRSDTSGLRETMMRDRIRQDKS